MSAITTIVINDGAVTPLAHTFAPNGNTGTEATYVDRATGISIGFPTLRTGLLQAGVKQPLNKVRFRLAVPRLEVVSGSSDAGFTPAPRLAYLCSVDCTMIFHERSTVQDRKDIRLLFRNLLADATAIDLIDNLAPAY